MIERDGGATPPRQFQCIPNIIGIKAIEQIVVFKYVIVADVVQETASHQVVSQQCCRYSFRTNRQIRVAQCINKIFSNETTLVPP